MVEGEVVAKDDEAFPRAFQDLHQQRQAGDVFAMHFHELERVADLLGHRRMGGFDQRGLAHAARAPQQHIVGGKAGGETIGVVEQNVAHMIDALDEREIDAVRPRDGHQMLADR